MQAYGELFAKVYNKRWTGFTTTVYPKLKELLDSMPGLAKLPKRLVDICCGTGQLAALFLRDGYTVCGVDLSPSMIEHANRNNREGVAAATARFLVADAAGFDVGKDFSVATCLYDAMNHLPTVEAVGSCIRRAYDALLPGGCFVFDINTRSGLARWNNTVIEEDDELFLLKKGLFDGSLDRAYRQITGFLRNGTGSYDRFCETVYNIVLPVSGLLEDIRSAGFSSVYCAIQSDLKAPIADGEQAARTYFVCRKS